MLTQSLTSALRAQRGLAHKTDIAAVVRKLGLSPAGIRLGDDCAAIPDRDGWLLLAIEGFVTDLVAAEPWFAGWCGVMVNASDIASMGGRPIAVVDAIWSRDQDHATPVLEGLAAAAAAYGIPVIGGHTNTRSAGEQLSVAILGRASRLLTSFDAKPGQVLLAAIDLRGAYHEPYPYWDSASTQVDSGRLRADLDLLAEIAEAGLSRAAKDISMAGLVGTALMLAECSAIGLIIDVDAVPRPDGVDLQRWLTSFPSYGFLLTATEADAPAVTAIFSARGIACAVIGRCEAGTRVDLRHDGSVETFWDLAETPLTGCGTL
ncbi:sll0787 family AIR synthase-like protein [Acidisoma cladoniae]|uniref:sll0787 family AIR synthase-like protein n=1 Tax=Acidisoma cladoniae TaxID=3040935 RepID=UPI00254C9B63|nr:sll0787 family AIR synthase-like protein [Acidisoma sp. PAMC 29798]